jgi:O-Antigen ligase
MDPRFRSWMIGGGSAVAALWFGWQIAQGADTLPALALVIGLAAILVRLTRLPADAILLGLLLFGYIVGNRGFAQLMPLPGLPLFPAEFGLAVGIGWLAVGSALRRELPWHGDFLNWAILLWLVVGTARVGIDLPRHGLFAVRDYAMVYYAAFFFLAQRYAANRRTRTYLVGTVLIAVAVLLPVYFLFSTYPLYFLFRLIVRGIPVIYLKGDLALTFLAAGSVLLFYWTRRQHRLWSWPLAAVMLLVVVASESRASLVGAFVAVAWLALGRRWAYPLVQAGIAVIVLTTIATLALSGNVPWARHQLDRLRDRVASIAAISPVNATASQESAYKLDNNRFRLVWWRTVLEQTRDQGPIFGLGFGYDLAAGFIETYDPAMTDDFTARSPHSIVVTTIGRMGAVGLATLLTLVAAMVLNTWREARRRSPDSRCLSLWCSAWVVFTSACFGVVLEGPMGAVVFWSLLGLASGLSVAERRSDPTPDTGQALIPPGLAARAD